MKITGILNKRLAPDGKAQMICGTVYSLLLGASLAVFGAFFLRMSPVVACLLFLVTAAPLIVLRLYRVLFMNTVILHLICGAAGVWSGILISDLCVNETESVRIVSAVSAGVVFCLFAELVSGFVMSFSGGEDHPEMFGKAFLYSCPLYFTIFLYIPSETFFNNAAEFKFIFTDFAPYMLIKMLLFTFVTAVFLCAFDERGFGVLTRLLCGLTLAVYAQYMFMNGVLPSALGEHVDWQSLTGECIVNAFIWLVIIALPFAADIVIKHIKSLRGNKHAQNAHNYVSVFLGGVQLITLVTLILTAERGVALYSMVSLSNQEQFTVSRGKNIITLIIDMADRDFFDEAQELHPEKFECLEDFTYYTNACMMYDSTYFSIPQMLTASEIIPKDTIDNWLSEIWGSDTAELFYKRLHENNYRVNIFGDFAFGYDPLRGKADNDMIVTSEDINIDRKLLYRAMDTISAYRWMPLGLKYNYEPGAFQGNDAVTVPNACILDNREFLSKLDLTFAGSDEDYFIVEHIIGTHGFTDTYDVETLDCLDILDRYFSELKRLGIYDDSLIIVTGDHGKHHKPDGVPIWYMKLPGEDHSGMQYNAAPIYHTDFAATCLDAVGLLRPEDAELLGRPVYSIGEDEIRTRLVFQRSEFEYVGDLERKLLPRTNSLYGYWFTGDRYDLKAREESAPPDIFLEIAGSF